MTTANADTWKKCGTDCFEYPGSNCFAWSWSKTKKTCTFYDNEYHAPLSVIGLKLEKNKENDKKFDEWQEVTKKITYVIPADEDATTLDYDHVSGLYNCYDGEFTSHTTGNI